MKRLTIFYHIAKINNWELIKNEHDELLQKIPGCEIIINSLEPSEIHQYEVPTLKKLWDYANHQSDNKVIGYIHSKGVSKPKDKLSRLWRETLNYWILHRWEDHLRNLLFNDVSGVRFYHLEVEGKYLPHYSGNFWFARSDYIKKLMDPSQYVQMYEPKFSTKKFGPERYGCEFWIGSGRGNMATVDNDETVFIRKGKAKMARGLQSFEYWKKHYG